jgi:lipoprotein-releasing system ATP-binding protein
MSMAVLTARALRQEYPTRSGPLVVLQGVDLDLDAGDAVAVIGPSGSGKSTLLHLLGTLARPSTGTVTIGGQNPFDLTEPKLAAFRNQKVGFIFQDHHLLPQCSALENVLIPTLVNRQVGHQELAQRGRSLLEKVGLGERLEHHPAELSGGERQRTAVCRALIHRPAVVLADEPTGSLDRQAAATVGDLLLDLCREEKVVLVCVTHSSELAGRFPRRMELVDGTLRAC